MKKERKRCSWPIAGDELYLKYHDEEWGVPVHDDTKIFEFLILESFQAGLSWRTVLYKRDNFRQAFLDFDYNKIARFTAKDQARLMQDAGIIRNRLKINAAVVNAQSFLAVRKEFGTFAKYMWSKVGGKPQANRFVSPEDYPEFTETAVAWGKDLKKRGFKFLGPTVLYSHMQAVGMVNDHTIDCFRYREVSRR